MNSEDAQTQKPLWEPSISLTVTTTKDSTNLKFNQIQNALQSQNESQNRIAEVGLDWITTLLSKNRDYGDSAWKEPVLAPELSIDSAIRVRMSDKIERIRNLLDKEPEVITESLEDTVNDLGAYCLLWLARPKDVPVRKS